MEEEESSLRKQKSKCRFFNTKRGCRNGADCPFRHVPPNRHNSIAQTHPDRPTKNPTQNPTESPDVKSDRSKPVTDSRHVKTIVTDLAHKQTDHAHPVKPSAKRTGNADPIKPSSKTPPPPAPSAEITDPPAPSENATQNGRRGSRQEAAKKQKATSAEGGETKPAPRKRKPAARKAKVADRPPVIPAALSFTWQREEKALRLIFDLKELKGALSDDETSGLEDAGREEGGAQGIEDGGAQSIEICEAQGIEVGGVHDGGAQASSREAVCRFSLVLQPSDPDIPSSLLFPHGLFLRLDVPAGYKESGTCAKCPILFVSDEAVDEHIAKGVRSKWSKIWEEAKGDSRPIYTALKMLDRELVDILLKAASHKQAWSSGPWTEAEQERLEHGLIWYRKIADQKLRWKNISDFVKTRGPRQCAERFQHCKQLAAAVSQGDHHKTAVSHFDHTSEEKKETDTSSAMRHEEKRDTQEEKERRQETLRIEKRDTPSEEIRDYPDEERRDSSARHASEASDLSDDGEPQTQKPEGSGKETKRLQGQSICLRGLQLSNLGIVTISRLAFLMECQRCGKKIDSSFSPARANSLGAAVNSVECGNCHQGIQSRSMAELAHSGGQGVVCRIEIVGGVVCDLLPSDLLASCLTCNGHVKFNEVYTAVRRSTVCRHCHVRTSLFFEATSILGEQKNVQTGSYVPMRKARPKDTFKLTVGEPLPLEGTCRHYRKSYRWFRFPCCGKAYPCDVCHDKESDHLFEQAVRMICGHCSRELSAHAKECSCGKAVTSAKSTHWEGGKGCRDPTLMSRKDDKKFKLMARAARKT